MTQTTTKTIDFNKEIKTLRGDSIPMSFPTDRDIDKVREEKNIEKVLHKDLPCETVRNILINSVAMYKVKSDKEVFYVHAIAQWIIHDQSTPLSDDLFDFLTKQILPAAVLMDTVVDGKVVEKGEYNGWVMAQVYAELGVNPTE